MARIPHYDVIIIGAGSVGAPAALSMAQARLRTLVLDGAASAGQGSNKRAIGGIRATHSDPAKIRLCLRSLEVFSTWQETYGDHIEWYQGGYCFAAYRPQEEKILKDLLSRQKEYGLNIAWLDPPALFEIAPGLNPNNLLGGSYSPGDGSASPLLAIHAFYRRAREHGASFHYNEPVTGIILRGDKIAGVRTPRGAYGADVVVNAAGPWADNISKLVHLELPVKPDSHEAAITEPVARFLDPMIVDIRPTPGASNFYFYQHITGQVLFCLTPSPGIWGFDENETSDFLPMAARRMAEIMPHLLSLRVRRTWRGLYPMTPDGNPIVGWLQQARGYLLAVGMCGQGFMLGPGVGELLARMVRNNLTQEDKQTLEYLSPDRQFSGQEMLK